MRNGTNGKFSGKLAFLWYMRKNVNLCLKARNQLQNQNLTEDWALGFNPHDNGHVTH